MNEKLLYGGRTGGGLGRGGLWHGSRTKKIGITDTKISLSRLDIANHISKSLSIGESK